MLTMYGGVPRCVGHVWLGSIGVLNLSFEVLFVSKCLPIYNMRGCQMQRLLYMSAGCWRLILY